MRLYVHAGKMVMISVDPDWYHLIGQISLNLLLDSCPFCCHFVTLTMVPDLLLSTDRFQDPIELSFGPCAQDVQIVGMYIVIWLFVSVRDDWINDRVILLLFV